MSEYLVYLFGVVFGALAIIFIVALVAELVARDPQNPWQTFGRAFGFFLGTDNRRWVVLLVICLFTTVIALTHPGDGLVKPLEEKIQQDPLRRELNEVSERHYNLRDYGLYKTNTEMCVISSEFRENNSHICEPAKEEVRTWVWWWLALTFWILLLIYTVPAFWDDVMRAGRRTYARLRAQAGGRAKFRPGNLIDRLFGGRGRQRGLETQTQPQAPTSGAAPHPEMNFWKMMMASLVPEVFVNILEWMSKGRRR